MISKGGECDGVRICDALLMAGKQTNAHTLLEVIVLMLQLVLDDK